jgi:hypothetical protein
VIEAHALQFHYTSCRRGLAGSPGWQTRAISVGVEHEERRELERIARYDPPRDVPVHLAPEPVCDAVPKTFRVTTLSSGRTAVVRMVYVGKDYSGRWGNFFAHGLLFDGPLVGRWPIDAYAWSGWVSRLDDGDDEREPQPLPPIPLEEITENADFSFDELRTFLLEADGRTQLLEQMLMAIFRRADDARRLVIRERHELEAVYWIACLQKAFPTSCQGSLSCSTFQFDPRNALAVNATMGETDFLFDEGERLHQFYVFDLVTGRHSDVPESHREYARTVTAWMASDPQRLLRFHEFVSDFGQRDIGPELLDLLRVYRLECGERLALPEVDFRSALALLRTLSLGPQLGRVLGLVGGLVRGSDASISPESRIEALRVLVEGAAVAENPAHWDLVFRLWVDTFDHVVANSDDAVQIATLTRGELVARLGDSRRRELAAAFLTSGHVERMLSLMGRLSDEGRTRLMCEVVLACQRVGQQPAYEAAEVRALIDVGLRHEPTCGGNLQWVLTPFGKDPDGVEAILVHLLTRCEEYALEGLIAPDSLAAVRRSIGRSLSPILGAWGDAERFGMINRVKMREGFDDVLLSEWEVSIAASSDRVRKHLQYAEEVLSDGSPFAEAMQGVMLATLLDALPRDEQSALAADWVRSTRSRTLAGEVAARVLALASQRVTLVPEDHGSETLAERIEEEVAERQLRLKPDRLALRRAAVRALTAADGKVGAPVVLDHVDPSSYREFVASVLPRLLNNARRAEEHGQALNVVACETHQRELADTYLTFLSDCPADRFGQADHVALEYWLALDDSNTHWPLLGVMRRPVLQALARKLGEMGRAGRAEARARFASAPVFKDPALRSRLDVFLDWADAQRPSWFERLRRVVAG